MESLNFNHLYYFHIVAEQGSVTGAAKVANVTKPTISAQLRQLEEFLGTELFERTGGRMRLNDAGRIAFRHTEVMFDAGRTLMRHFRREESEPSQTLRIGVGSDVARSIAADFFDPLLELDGTFLRIRHGDAPHLREALLALEIDLLVVDAAPPGHEDLGLAATLLETTPMVAVIGASERLDAGGLEAMLERRPVLHHWKHTHLHWRIEEWLAEHHVRPRVDALIDDVPTMLAMVARGGAIAFVPESAIGRAQRAGEVQVVSALEGLDTQTYALYVRRDVPELVETAVARLCRVPTAH